MGLRPWIGCEAVGESHPLGVEPQRQHQLLLHAGGEGAAIAAAEPHVLIEVETEPALPQALALGNGQQGQLAGQGVIDRLHRAAGGQTERPLRPPPPLIEQAGCHVLGHRRRIGQLDQLESTGSLG